MKIINSREFCPFFLKIKGECQTEFLLVFITAIKLLSLHQ